MPSRPQLKITQGLKGVSQAGQQRTASEAQIIGKKAEKCFAARTKAG